MAWVLGSELPDFFGVCDYSRKASTRFLLRTVKPIWPIRPDQLEGHSQGWFFNAVPQHIMHAWLSRLLMILEKGALPPGTIKFWCSNLFALEQTLDKFLFCRLHLCFQGNSWTKLQSILLKKGLHLAFLRAEDLYLIKFTPYVGTASISQQDWRTSQNLLFWHSSYITRMIR